MKFDPKDWPPVPLLIAFTLGMLLPFATWKVMGVEPFVISAADPPAPINKLVTDIANRLDGRITETLGTAIVCVEEVQALRRERTPSKVPAPAAVKKAGG